MTKKFREMKLEDVDKMADQWLFINNLVEEKYGQNLIKEKEDLTLLENLINDKHISGNDEWHLQSLSVALGRVFAHKNDGFEWVMVEDSQNQDAALRYHNNSILVFPKSMVQKRVIENENQDINFLYDSTLHKIKMMKEVYDKKEKN